MDYIPYIQDLINNNKALSKIRAGINTIKNGGDNAPMIEPVIIPENPNVQIGGIDEVTQKNRLIDNIANGINDFQLGFRENYNTGFNPSNLTDQKFSPIMQKNKGLMGRFGEAVGTVRRALDKPVVQGLVNGAISTALIGSPMFGYVHGLNSATNKANSDVYSQALKNEGFDVPDGLFNLYSASDLESMTNPEIKRMQQEYLNQYRQERNDIDRTYKENRIKNEERRIANEENKPQDYKPQNEPTWKQDLADYATRKNDPRYADKLDLLKAKYIKRYGVDPDKYIE